MAQSLRQTIIYLFSLNELVSLCYDLGIDHERLPHDTKDKLVVGLIRTCQRTNRLPELQKELQLKRPGLPWEPLFTNLPKEEDPNDTDPVFPLRHLPPFNPNFTGRSDLLQWLANDQTSNDGNHMVSMRAICGLGGVGKSQLALAYAYNHLEAYDLVYWLSVEPESTVGSELATLGRALGLPVDDIADQQKIIQQVKAWLAGTSRRWLLLFDNADSIEPRALRPYLPGSGPGRVIIASRNCNWAGVVGREQVRSIDVFTSAEAVDFVQGRLPDEDPVAIAALAEELGYLPLALEHAVAFMETRASSAAAYRRLYQEKRQALWARAEPPDAYHATITTTWEMGFQHARQTPGASELLNLCCCLAPDSIPLTLIQQIREIELPHPQVAEPLLALLADELAFGDALLALSRYALLTHERDTICLHRLVQQVALDRMGAERRNAWVETAVALLAATWSFDQHDMSSWPACAALLPQMSAVAIVATQAGLESEQVAQINSDTGFYLNAFGEPTIARAYYERGLAIREAILSPDHLDTARSLNNLGALLKTMGELADARIYMERALAIREAVLGPDHPDTAITIDNLGTLLFSVGDLAAARPHFERALAIREAELGEDHPDTARSLNNLAFLLDSLGDFAGAKPHYERSLAINESKLGPDHPLTATSLNNLGYILRAMGDLAGARHRYERALAIRETVLGANHPDTASSLHNFAWLHHDEGAYQIAHDLLQRALAIREAKLGANHPKTVSSRESLAIIAQKLP